MSRTFGWAAVALAAVGLLVIDVTNAEARHRRGQGSDGGYGSNGGNGSFGSNGSFGGRFSRRGGGSCGYEGSYGSNGGNGSAGGNGSCGGYGGYVEGEEHVVEYGDRTYDPSQPPRAPEMRGEGYEGARAPEMTREEAERAENSEENMQNSAAQNPAIGNAPANQEATTNSSPDRGI